MPTTHTLMQPAYVRSNLAGTQPLSKGDPNSTAFGCAEDSSQAWLIGDLIYHDNTDEGLLKICGTTSSKLNTEVAGQANKAAVGVKNTFVHFRPILPTDIYAMNVYHSTAASAITVATQLGKVYGLIYTGGRWHVDIENTTVEDGTTALAAVRVHGFMERHPMSLVKLAIGDIYGVVLVTFLLDTIATDGSPHTRLLQYA